MSSQSQIHNPVFNMHRKYLKCRRTKIVATIGPASNSSTIIRKLVRKGLNVARINFSHGIPEEHEKLIRKIRDIAESEKKSVAILADLSGPKVRVGRFENGRVLLQEKKEVIITTKNVFGTDSLIPSQYKGIVKEANAGERVFLDDGNLELKITGKKEGNLVAKVIRGGFLSDKKGMNLPDTTMKISALTPKDKRDIEYCIRAEVDYVALSFVRSESDIKKLKNFLKKRNSSIPVIAKIEKPQAVENIADIISVSDGIMIARGDLGVELPPQKIPLFQNALIGMANEYNKPVIVATQMLETMTENKRPTRAEVTDVSSAALAGADAVMLSAETAVGKYPLEAFSMMDTILREAEAHQFFSLDGHFMKSGIKKNPNLQGIIGVATAQLSRDLKVRSVVILTRSGHTANMISSDRPAAPILAITGDPAVRQRLNLLWGITPFLSDKNLSFEDYIIYAENMVLNKKLGKRGEYIILLSGVGSENQATNSIVIHQIK